MSKGSNRAHAKLAAKRGALRKVRPTRGTPSTEPYHAAAALTRDDLADLQRAIDNAPGGEVLAMLASAAASLERAHEVTARGTCGHCGHSVTVRDQVRIPALVAIAGELRDLREQLARFDPDVLQRIIDGMGQNASLWWTGKGG